MSTSSCVSAVDNAESLMTTQLPGELDSVLNAIKADAPNARVVVLDYPDLYDLSKSSLLHRAEHDRPHRPEPGRGRAGQPDPGGGGPAR